LPKKINGAVTLYSNSPGQATGYGVQGEYLINNLKRDGADVAAISNYGLEGSLSTHKTPYGKIPHYPRGIDPYSNDVAPMHHAHFVSQHKDKPNAMLTLYDVWILKGKAWDNINIGSWVPVDHAGLTPAVETWLRKDNVVGADFALTERATLSRCAFDFSLDSVSSL